MLSQQQTPIPFGMMTMMRMIITQLLTSKRSFLPLKQCCPQRMLACDWTRFCPCVTRNFPAAAFSPGSRQDKSWLMAHPLRQSYASGAMKHSRSLQSRSRWRALITQRLSPWRSYLRMRICSSSTNPLVWLFTRGMATIAARYSMRCFTTARI